MSKLFTWRRVLVAATIALLAGAIAAGTAPIFDTSPTDPVVTQPRQAPKQEPLVPTDLGQVEEAFGPFTPMVIDLNTPTPDTGEGLLILQGDGSVLASTRYTVPFDQSWTLDSAREITSLSVKLGYVTMGTSFNDRVFVVKALQPFVFADDPGHVYAVTVQGQIRSVTTAVAEAMMQTFK